MRNRTLSFAVVAVVAFFHTGCTSSKEVGQQHLRVLVEKLESGSETLEKVTSEAKLMEEADKLQKLADTFRDFHAQDQRLSFSRSNRDQLLEEYRERVGQATRQFRMSLRKALVHAKSKESAELLNNLTEAFVSIFKVEE